VGKSGWQQESQGREKKTQKEGGARGGATEKGGGLGEAQGDGVNKSTRTGGGFVFLEGGVQSFGV